jgi:hypothetical protein
MLRFLLGQQSDSVRLKIVRSTDTIVWISTLLPDPPGPLIVIMRLEVPEVSAGHPFLYLVDNNKKYFFLIRV